MILLSLCEETGKMLSGLINNLQKRLIEECKKQVTGSR